MAGLQEAAKAAAKTAAADRRAAHKKNLEEALTKIIEGKWFDYGGWKSFDTIPDVPPREEFTYIRNVPGEGYREERLEGWAFTLDGATFLFVRTHGQEGLRVILKCPECGVEHASNFTGLANLGEKLTRQRGLFHKCRELEAKQLAAAIGRAAADSKLSPQAILDEAFQKHSDIIYRLSGL